MRRDLPALIERLRVAHPDVDIESVLPAGEDDGVLDAIVAYCVRQLPSD
jgi:sirohydrochlorin cobaltochelatase